MKHLPFSRRSALTQSEWEVWAGQLMAEGRFFAAYDTAQQGLQHFPDSRALKQLQARALMRTGGIDEAKAILEGLLPPILADTAALEKFWQRWQDKLQPTAAPGAQQFLEAIADLRQFLEGWQGRLFQAAGPDEESIGLLARIYKDLWKRTGDPALARQSYELYSYGYGSTGGYWTGINAATMSLISGESARARELAARVVGQCQEQLATAKPEELYWLQATRGEGFLLLGQSEAAIAAYEAASRQVDGHYDYIVSSRQQLRLLEQHGITVPPEIWTALKPPTVVVFTGHMLDQPGRTPARFPAELLPAVQQAIEGHLTDLEVQLGFSGAAGGADLLFLEAMQQRQARTHVVLPFALEDYLQTSVAFAGRYWPGRCQRALKLADSVRFVTTERYLGDDVLFRFANLVLQGLATLHAQRLDTAPHLLAVWDGVPSPLPGGTADMIAQWPDAQRLHVIRLDELRAQTQAPGSGRSQPPEAPAPAAPAPSPTAGRRRVIKALLFADIHQFSKITEEQLPLYVYEFLERLAAAAPPPPGLINTWGDAIFLALDEALPLVEYAFALRDAVVQTDWRQVGLPAHLNLRIALHAGPVFQATDALTGRENLYGTHVNRAARLEPRTPPGKIYASEQFAALLLTEQQLTPPPRRPAVRYVCDYAGIVSLPKDFGRQPVFHIRRLSDHEAQYA